jgi:hypothetical protein
MRPPQHSGDRRPVERYFDAFTRRVEKRQRVAGASHGLQVGGAHLIHIVNEHELGEVVVDRGLRQMCPGRALAACGERLPAQSLVDRAGHAPLLAPRTPALDR